MFVERIYLLCNSNTQSLPVIHANGGEMRLKMIDPVYTVMIIVVKELTRTSPAIWHVPKTKSWEIPKGKANVKYKCESKSKNKTPKHILAHSNKCHSLVVNGQEELFGFHC